MSLLIYCAKCDWPVGINSFNGFMRCFHCKDIFDDSVISLILSYGKRFGVNNAWVEWISQKYNIILRDDKTETSEEKLVSVFCDLLDRDENV